VFENLKLAAEKFPERAGVIYQGVEYSYEKLWGLAARMANALRNLGVEKEDRVAIYLPNVPQFIIAYYGILACGAVTVACNAMYREKEIEYLLKDSGAKIIITLDELKPVVDAVRDKTDIEQVIVTSRDEALSLMSAESAESAVSEESMAKLLSESRAELSKVDLNPKENLAVLQYTGGTTGTPKGAMLTHYNLIVDQVQEATWFEFREGKETAIIFLPISHIYGMNWCMNTMILVAGTIVLMERFEPSKVLEYVNLYKPTIFYGVPTAYIALLDHPDVKKADFSRMRTCFSAAAPLPPEVRRRWKEVTGADIIEAWGLTEAAPCLTCTPLGMSGDKLIGVPMPDTEVKVVDIDTGEDLPPGEVGELVGKGPQIMKGYWNKPDETKNVLKDGWLFTGDLGYMDENGLFYFIDRKKDLINVAGYKVWPDEVENVLYEHPAVKEAAVVASPDPQKGEVPKAFVALREEYKGTVSEEELIKFCKEKLAPFKAPKKIEFVDELPKTPVGKILRRALREREWSS
jgi:long-chain acyl-CoA synthetase